MTKKKKNKPWWYGLLLMAAGAAIGYIGAKLLTSRDISSSSESEISILGIIVILFLVFFLVILIHELGHVIGGILMGNEFSFIIVGPFK